LHKVPVTKIQDLTEGIMVLQEIVPVLWINRVSSTTRVVAVNTLNINTIDKDWRKYRVSVRDIEKATGYNLLSNLPQSIQYVIETKVDALN
jgi:endonuclease G